MTATHSHLYQCKHALFLHFQAYGCTHTHMYIHTGAHSGLHDGDACTFGIRKSRSALRSLYFCLDCTDGHDEPLVSPLRVFFAFYTDAYTYVGQGEAPCVWVGQPALGSPNIPRLNPSRIVKFSTVLILKQLISSRKFMVCLELKLKRFVLVNRSALS